MNNNNSNNNNHEIIFWKVFRNVYIRNYILSNIINNNESNYSYNGTTSLKLMLKNNKLHMILDKLKSNHHIHIDCIPNWNKKKGIRDPYYKSITTEINHLLWLNYSHSIISLGQFKYIDFSYNQDLLIERYKLSYPENKNNYNNYMAHSLLYKLLDKHHNDFQAIEYLNQLINNSNNNIEYNHINKKQKINNNINNNSFNNSNNQNFIDQLLLKSSSSPALENEIIKAIYNDQPIPTHLYHIISILGEIKFYNNQDLYENQLKLDIKSILLNLDRETIIYNCHNNEVLELVVLKLLYNHHHEINSHSMECEYYPVNSIIHAKIYCLNELNDRCNKKKPISSILKFKRHLINKQVNTLEELISAAREILGDNSCEEYLGHYYYYYLIYSNKLEDDVFIKESEYSTLLLHYSIITQQIKPLDRYLELSINHINDIIQFKSIRNIVGSDFNINNNNNQQIKDKSTTYFNHLIIEVNKLYKKDNNQDEDQNEEEDEEDENEYKFRDKDVYNGRFMSYYGFWLRVFKIIVNSYNSKLFEWLLESNKQLQDIYHRLIGNSEYFVELFLEQSIMDIDSDQVDYEMLDVLINHIKTIDKFPYGYKYNNIFSMKGIYIYSVLGSDDVNSNNSNQRKVKILNHLIKSTLNNNSLFIKSLINDMLVNGFSSLKLYDIIKIYNQIDQQQLFNYCNSLNYNTNYLNNQNKSSILVPLLIQSIINLDFNSINKIISATLNNNDNIPTTFNNSLDIIKYLISNNYLKEFNLYYILETIISNIQLDKEFIIEIIQLSNNNNNKSSTTTTTDELISKIEQLYKENDQENKKDEEDSYDRFDSDDSEDSGDSEDSEDSEDSDDSEDSEDFEESKDSKDNEDEEKDEEEEEDDDDDDETDDYKDYKYYQKQDKMLSKANSKFNLRGYFNEVDIYRNNRAINQHCYQNPPEMFEFIWNNHFNNNHQRSQYIVELLTDRYRKYYQLKEYVLKREFITTSVKLNKDQLLDLHYNSLTYNNQIFHLVRSVFSSFKFEINYKILKQLFKNKYETIKYLFENNLIPNLEQIIGTANLNRLRIKEYHKHINREDGGVYISKSMFILIHTIIKLQKQHQPRTREEEELTLNQ